VRLVVYVAPPCEFAEQISVADAASELLGYVFDEESISARSVVRVESLPLGVPVELEVVFEVQPESRSQLLKLTVA
jgi:enamine deaminase RidA (YjgF/YER057c/UK114 family)